MALAAPSIGVNDPNDVAGPLDMFRFEGVRTASGRPIAIRVTFHQRLSNAALAPGGGGFMQIFLNTDGDTSTDYVGSVYKAGTRLTVHFRGSGNSFENLPVTRPSPMTIRFVIPGGAPLAPNGPVAIRGVTGYTSGPACRLGCFDEVPNSGDWIAV
jgi:hypothetical protein